MKDDEFAGMLYELYKAWCREHELDPNDGDNRREFLDRALPA